MEFARRTGGAWQAHPLPAAFMNPSDPRPWFEEELQTSEWVWEWVWVVERLHRRWVPPLAFLLPEEGCRVDPVPRVGLDIRTHQITDSGRCGRFHPRRLARISSTRTPAARTHRCRRALAFRIQTPTITTSVGIQANSSLMRDSSSAVAAPWLLLTLLRLADTTAHLQFHFVLYHLLSIFYDSKWHISGPQNEFHDPERLGRMRRI